MENKTNHKECPAFDQKLDDLRRTECITIKSESFGKHEIGKSR